MTDDRDVSIQENEYDGLNSRIRKQEREDNDLNFTYDYYYNQQWQVLEIRKNGSTNPWKQYVYHPYYVDAIATRYYDENIDGLNIDEHYYLQDANFNVTAVTDDTGTVVERYSYTPYGEVTFLDANFVKRSPHQSDIDNEYLYTGRRRDPETGLQLNRNRFYASHLGRWVNRDPIGYEGGRNNLYVYVGSMPTPHIDSCGLIPPNDDFPLLPPLQEFPKGTPDPWPWDIFGEADDRRGSAGDDSAHHCWAVCMAGSYIPGSGTYLAIGGVIVEEIVPSDDSAEDNAANFKGATCSLSAFVAQITGGSAADTCDCCCGTKK